VEEKEQALPGFPLAWRGDDSPPTARLPLIAIERAWGNPLRPAEGSKGWTLSAPCRSHEHLEMLYWNDEATRHPWPWSPAVKSAGSRHGLTLERDWEKDSPRPEARASKNGVTPVSTVTKRQPG